MTVENRPADPFPGLTSRTLLALIAVAKKGDLVPLKFNRYAVYFAPRPDTDLARFGAEWLGVDAETGAQIPAPSGFVESPRRYAFHATLKAPMRLADGVSYDQFKTAVSNLADHLSPVDLGVLRLNRIGPFLALMVQPELHHAVSELAWHCVRELDQYRAPLNDAERARRSGLPVRQAELFEKWGYPYVDDEFRFHMTLTSALDDVALIKARAELTEKVPNTPAMLDSISIFGDPGAPHSFRVLDRFDLSG